MTAHDHAAVVRFGSGEVVVHASLSGFAYPVDAMFAGLYLDD